jgi:hypothetical protein
MKKVFEVDPGPEVQFRRPECAPLLGATALGPVINVSGAAMSSLSPSFVLNLEPAVSHARKAHYTLVQCTIFYVALHQIAMQ